jgi:hypothetical protein
MTRIVELLIAINAIAGIAAFLGLRRVVRARLFRRDQARPEAPMHPVRPTSSRALKLLGAKPVEMSSSQFSERVYIRFRDGHGRTDVITGVSEEDAREEAEAYARAMNERDEVESALVLEQDAPDGPAVWRTSR